MLPQEMGCGSGVTCWRRLRYWQRRGVWKKLLHTLLQRVGQEKGIDWEHCCVDSQSFRAVFGEQMGKEGGGGERGGGEDTEGGGGGGGGEDEERGQRDF